MKVFATRITDIWVLVAARNSISLITLGQASASTQILNVSFYPPFL